MVLNFKRMVHEHHFLLIFVYNRVMKANEVDIEAKIGTALHELQNARVNRSLESQWILRQLGDENLMAEVMNLSVVALHILSNLTKQDLTGIELATNLRVTRGAITRAAGNLTQFDFAELYQKEDDKKKIFYHLTDKGRKVADVHDKMHEKIDEIFEKQIFAHYTAQEKQVILNFLKQVNEVDTQLDEKL